MTKTNRKAVSCFFVTKYQIEKLSRFCFLSRSIIVIWGIERFSTFKNLNFPPLKITQDGRTDGRTKGRTNGPTVGRI